MSNPLNIALGADHAGFEYKNSIKKMLEELGYTTQDFGTNSPESVDYPDYVHPVAEVVEQGKASFGLLFCGSANGVAITANKHQDIRAAICWNEELSSLARQHNNANILCVPARFVSEDVAKSMVKKFLSTEFEGGRHQNRVNKIPVK